MPRAQVVLPDIGTGVSPEEAQALFEYARGKRVLDCGSWYGFSAAVMCQSAKEVHAVDWFKGDEHAGSSERQLEDFHANTKYLENLVVHQGSFDRVLPLLRPAKFGFAFLDGFHSKDATLRLYRLVRPLVLGWIGFHDYGLFGVKDAVDSLGGPQRMVGSLALINKHGRKRK